MAKAELKTFNHNLREFVTVCHGQPVKKEVGMITKRKRKKYGCDSKYPCYVVQLSGGKHIQAFQYSVNKLVLL